MNKLELAGTNEDIGKFITAWMYFDKPIDITVKPGEYYGRRHRAVRITIAYEQQVTESPG